MMLPWSRLAACALVPLLILAACGRGGEEPAAAPADRIERIGEQALTERQFERFVKRYAGVPAAEIDPAAREQLYEEFLAEVLFARAAERAGLEADEEAVRREIERAGAGDAGEELERDARQAVLARLYEERVLAPRVTVTPEEIEKALGAAPKRSRRDFAVFRQIRVESKEQATEAYRRTVRHKEPFDVVAREMSSAPDGGALQQRALNNLPGPIVSTLRKLPEGGISRPVEYDGAYYLFELEALNRDPDPDRGTERKRVEQRLWSQKLAALKLAELEKLAAEEGIRTPRTALGEGGEP